MEQTTQAQNEIISSQEVPAVAAPSPSTKYSLVCDKQIVQPANDERTYKMIRLFENKLEILLVYDQEEGKSAAAVNVNAGYLQDPIHRQGLAHFLEHMLFLGTEKFPNADFDEFLNENAGYSNAYTDYMETNYYFQCAGNAFREGLDRFASFFVAPLFNEDLVNREMNAVNSEHSNNLQEDDSRIAQLLDCSAIPESPLTKFGTGNLETLQHESTRADLIEFYKEYYSANLMKVCIVTHEPLDQIEPYIVDLFEKIPNKDKPAPSFVEKPFPNENFTAFWKYTPIKNENSIDVAWTTDYFSQNAYYKHPLSYWTHVFGFEGENSLLSALKALGYAEGLSSGDTDVMKNSAIFYINIELTNEGLANYMHVLDVTFAYVKTMKSLGAQEYIYNEERISGIQSFNSQDQEEPMDYAHRLTANMQLFPPHDVLKGNSYCEEYDPVLLNKTIQNFTAQNMRILLKSQSCEAECTYVEKYYGSKYIKLPLPQEIIDLFENPKYDVNGNATTGAKKIGLPPKNPFICADLTLVDIPESELAHRYPRVIKDDEKSTVYFKQDTKYKVPKTIVNVIIHSNDGDRRENCENQLLSVLWHKLFKESTREFEYQAEMAKMYSKLRFKVSTEILFEGFSASVQAYVTEYITRLSKFDPSTMESEFRVQLDQLSKKLHNFSKKQPYEQGKALNFFALKSQGAFSNSDKVKSVEGINFEKLLAFHASWFKNIRLSWIIAGNIQEETARQFILSLEDILFTNRTPLPKEEVYVPVSVSLKSSENSDFVFESKLDSEEKNSYISSVFEFEHVSLHHEMLVKLIETFLEEPFYSSLRTEQQLGYIVWSYGFAERTKHFYQFQIQSDKKSPQYLQNQIKEFIDEMAEEVEEMGDEDFDVLKKSVDLEPAHSLTTQISRYWLQIQNRRLMFDFRERQVQELEAITLEQFKAAFDSIFFTKRANLQLHLISSVHQDENDQIKGEKEWEDDGDEDNEEEVDDEKEEQKENKDEEEVKEKKSKLMERNEDKFIEDISAFKVSQPKNEFLYL